MNNKNYMMKFIAVILIACSFSVVANAQNWDSLSREAAKTEIWEPQPQVVKPLDVFMPAPADAVILFDGNGLNAWRSVNDTSQAAGWNVKNGVMTVDKSTGNIETKQRFMDYQLHLEWRIPASISGDGQIRGNSGLFLASTGSGDAGYEIQILDNYNNKTYANGQVGSVYKQSIPLANACKKTGEWQSYDIVWKAPRFKPDGSLLTPAYVTVVHNGIVLQNNFELKGETKWIGPPSYTAHGACPIKLQSHGDPSEPISFRNIWVRPL